MFCQINRLANYKQNSQTEHSKQLEVNPVIFKFTCSHAQLKYLSLIQLLTCFQIDRLAGGLKQGMFSLKIEIGNIQVSETHQYKKNNPTKIKSAPDLLWRFNCMAHHSFHQRFITDNLTQQETEGKGPVNGCWFPHKKSFVL